MSNFQSCWLRQYSAVFSPERRTCSSLRTYWGGLFTVSFHLFELELWILCSDPSESSSVYASCLRCGYSGMETLPRPLLNVAILCRGALREVVVVFSTKLYLKEVVIHVKYKGGREGVQNQSLNISSISGSIITQFVIFQTFQNRSIIFPLTI